MFIHDNILIKEHAIGNWNLITCSAWKNSSNVATRCSGILVRPREYNYISSVDNITPRMIMKLYGNLQKAVITHTHQH